jgi:hypothetical protein
MYIYVRIYIYMRIYVYICIYVCEYMYKVVQIWPGLIVCKQVTVCPCHIWTTLYKWEIKLTYRRSPEARNGQHEMVSGRASDYRSSCLPWRRMVYITYFQTLAVSYQNARCYIPSLLSPLFRSGSRFLFPVSDSQWLFLSSRVLPDFKPHKHFPILIFLSWRWGRKNAAEVW